MSLTGQNFEGEGVLLLDGVCEEEASVAAVVSVSVFGQNVGEVQVPVQTHGHSLILRDRIHRWKTEDRRNKYYYCWTNNNYEFEVTLTFYFRGL